MNNAKKRLTSIGIAVLSACAFVPDMHALSSGNPYKPSPAIESKVDALVQKIRDRVSPLDQTKQKAFFDSFDRKLGGLRAKFSQKKEVLALLNGVAYETDALRKSLSSWGEAGLLEDLMGSVDSADTSGNGASGGDGAASNPSSSTAANASSALSCEKKATNAQEFTSKASLWLGQGSSDFANYPGNYLRGIPANEHTMNAGHTSLYRQLIFSAWAQDVEFKKGTWADWQAMWYAVPSGTNASEAQVIGSVMYPLYQAGFNTDGSSEKLKYGYDWIGALRTFLSDERVADIIKKQAAKQVDGAGSQAAKDGYAARWKAYDCFLGKNVTGLSK